MISIRQSRQFYRVAFDFRLQRTIQRNLSTCSKIKRSCKPSRTHAQYWESAGLNIIYYICIIYYISYIIYIISFPASGLSKFGNQNKDFSEFLTLQYSIFMDNLRFYRSIEYLGGRIGLGNWKLSRQTRLNQQTFPQIQIYRCTNTQIHKYQYRNTKYGWFR